MYGGRVLKLIDVPSTLESQSLLSSVMLNVCSVRTEMKMVSRLGHSSSAFASNQYVPKLPLMLDVVSPVDQRKVVRLVLDAERAVVVPGQMS